ncbi:MAG: DUF6875 domain-containing protein [Verrucomicrobiota bacterium]
MPVVPEESTTRLDLLPDPVALSDAADSSVWVERGLSPEAAEKTARCAEWSSTFPRQRVQKRGRREAICPMVEPSIRDRAIWVSALELGLREPSLGELDRILRAAADQFETQVTASDAKLRCLIVVLPGVRGARLLEATDPVRGIKRELLKRGILAGEFFPSCPFATTFNPRLFALRSPGPMYVLRSFIETDWKFICKVPAWQFLYRERFGAPPRSQARYGGWWWRQQERLRWRWEAVLNRLTSEEGVR